MKKPSVLRNQSGFMTMDFLFAIALILGFWILLFSISITLTTSSVVQYITYASARNYFAAHADSTDQVKKAEQKYRELVDNNVFKPMLKGNWFEVYDKPDVGDISQIKQGYDTEGSNQYWGVGTNFTAKILDFKIPFFGSTDPEGSGDGRGFQTYLSSFLGREPTANECWKFMEGRWRAIRNLAVSHGASYSTGTSEQSYNVMEDSGC